MFHAWWLRTADQVLAASLADRRFLTGLMCGFAAVAVFLAVIGLYGVLSYTVAHRTREFGVRLALGARGAQVIAVVLRQGLTIVFAGVAAGFLEAFALSRVLSTLLYNVSPHDALVFSTVPLIIFAAGAFSCWLPARRAAKVDPAIALRWE